MDDAGRLRIREENFQNAIAALCMVREAIELVCPPGVLPSEEAVLMLYGPEPVHEGEALAKAIVETVNILTSARPSAAQQTV